MLGLRPSPSKPDARQAENTPSDVAPGAEMVLHVVQKRAYQVEFLGL
jgi:hypothetical protein